MSFIIPYSSNSLKKKILSSLSFLADHSNYRNNLSWCINVQGVISDTVINFPTLVRNRCQRFVVMWFSETANKWFS